jgi:hypothetical protein
MKRTSLTGFLCIILGVSSVGPHGLAQAGTATAATPSSTPQQFHSRYTPNHAPKKAAEYYSLVWGVDSLSVRAVESGTLIRFSYRVLDPQKAGVFNNKKIEAFLESPSHRIRLVVPSLEKVGQLRQINTPEEDHSYWMVFSNPHRTVKPGDRVNVTIGRFRADGLVIE